MTDIDPSYWEPPDDPEAEDRFFDAFADAVREAQPYCPMCGRDAADAEGTPGCAPCDRRLAR